MKEGDYAVIYVKNEMNEITRNTGIEFMLTKNFILNASYDNRFGFGGGLSVLF